ncbi:MAG: PEP-CTERM sorting domain-containing protein [Verrucomicrobiota bacterium]|jgi:hypothetical protein
MNTLKNGLLVTALCSVVSLGLAQMAHAQLVQNGGFETTTTGPNSDSTTGSGQLGWDINATDWSVGPPSTTSPTYPNSYDFLFASGAADSTGALGQYGVLTLYGPGNGHANGLPATSPVGGNYVGLDADVAYQAALSQTITGLTPGKTYALTFYWAGAQQTTFNGSTTDYLTASLGSQSHNTATISVPSDGFDPWTQVTFDYTATSASEVLSFLATGTPTSPNEPPFVLLDGVSLTSTTAPDSTTTAVLLIFAAMILFFVARRHSAGQFRVENQAP